MRSRLVKILILAIFAIFLIYPIAYVFPNALMESGKPTFYYI